jgi:hypothetical protein
LLEQETTFFVEEEDGKGAVELAAGLLGRETVTVVLVFRACELILVVHHKAFVLAHEVILAHAGAFAPPAVCIALLCLYA